MGHTRLGVLPRTRKWIQVVDLIESEANVEEIASATMDAAKRGISESVFDQGLVYSFWLLTQIPLAAREEDFASALWDIGLSVPSKPELLEIVTAYTNAVDEYVSKRGVRSDVSEMAVMAAAECMTTLVSDRTKTLFDTSPEEVKSAFHEYSKTKQFGYLSKQFFARFVNRYLSYFLSHELSNHVGGDRRFSNIDSHKEFSDALELHCQEAAYIVQDFSGSWYSKTVYEGGISRDKAANFLFVALKKLSTELAMGAREDDQ